MRSSPPVTGMWEEVTQTINVPMGLICLMKMSRATFRMATTVHTSTYSVCRWVVEIRWMFMDPRDSPRHSLDCFQRFRSEGKSHTDSKSTCCQDVLGTWHRLGAVQTNTSPHMTSWNGIPPRFSGSWQNGKIMCLAFVFITDTPFIWIETPFELTLVQGG